MKTGNHIERIIKAEISKAKETQNAIAIKTGVTRDILCRFMQGTRGLSTDSAAALLDYFGYTILRKTKSKRGKGTNHE